MPGVRQMRWAIERCALHATLGFSHPGQALKQLSTRSERDIDPVDESDEFCVCCGL